jgi:hypothetical protein
MEVLADEEAEITLVEDHLVGREEDGAGHNLEQQPHVLMAPDVVPDDDVGALEDEVLPSPDLDSLGKKGKVGQAQDALFYPFQLAFKTDHGSGSSLYEPARALSIAAKSDNL